MNVQHVVDCPDCDGYEKIYTPVGYQKCLVCGGQGQIVVSASVDACEDEIRDAVWSFRENRMSGLFRHCTDNTSVCNAQWAGSNNMQQWNEQKWQELAHEALAIADELRSAITKLEEQRARLQQISSLASELPPPRGSEQKKQDFILHSREMMLALDQAGVEIEYGSFKGAA